jgi:hypothetical protein
MSANDVTEAKERHNGENGSTSKRGTAPRREQQGRLWFPLILPPNSSDPLQPLQYSLALLAHLVYLARRSEAAQQQRYLDCAAKVIEEMQHHPKLCD